MSQLKAIQDPLLSGVSSGYFPKGMIGDMILPRISSLTSSGKLAAYGTNHLRVENGLKGGRGEYRRVEAITRSTSSYLIDGHGLEGLVTKEDYKNVQDPFDAERDETLGVTTLLAMEKESLMAASLFSSSVMTAGATLNGADQWSDYQNSSPLSKVTTAKNTILNAVGEEPNVMIVDAYLRNILRYHPQLLAQLGYNMQRAGGLKDQEIADAMGIDKIIVASARYESAKEGQNSSLAAVWGKHCLFAVLPDSAVPYQVSAGYMVGYVGEGPRKVYKYALNNPPGSNGILVEDNYDIIISNVNAAYLFTNAVA